MTVQDDKDDFDVLGKKNGNLCLDLADINTFENDCDKTEYKM